jgi:lipopolysaccharide biosynthesis glycosyltransferase
MNLVFQVSIQGDASGNKMFSYREELYEESCRRALGYSKKCNASYFCLRDKVVDLVDFHPGWQRYVIFTDERFDFYENILYLDSDVIVREGAENIFDRFSNRGFCAAPVLYTDPNLEDSRLRNIQTQCDTYNIDINYYFNTGVFVVDKETRRKIRSIDFQKNIVIPGDKNDQPAVNALVLNNNLFNRLDWRFNFICKAHSKEDPRKKDAYFLHYLDKDLFFKDENV